MPSPNRVRPARSLTVKDLERLRAHNFRQVAGRYVHTEAEALAFISEVGFVSLINLSETEFPSLQMADDREDWGDYEERTLGAKWWWAWKQTLPARKACYYAKILRGRGTFISWRYLPYFIAAYGSGRDLEFDYRRGLVPRADKRVMDLLSERGPMDTRRLRLAYAPPSRENTRQLEASLARLQAAFRICCAGGSLKGWTLHRWAVLERWAPQRVLARAASLTREQAMGEIALRYLRTVVAATPADIAWLFRWERAEVKRIILALRAAGRVMETQVRGVEGTLLQARRGR
jgi:hypothetical protein